MSSDRELVIGALGGSAAAAEVLLLRHWPMLLSFARRNLWRTGNGESEIEDVLQEFAVKVCANRFRALAQWGGLTDLTVESIKPYFRRILRNVMVDIRRRRHEELALGAEDEEEDDLEGPGPGPDDEVANAQLRAMLRECIHTALNDRQRAVVQRSFAGQGHKEIAAALGISVDNSRQLLVRGTEALAQCVKLKSRHGLPGRNV